MDATTGQNAILQAQLFHEGVGLSGLILTKLDATAKGGISVIVGIAYDLKLPVTYIGIGERVEDLREFHANEFVDALLKISVGDGWRPGAGKIWLPVSCSKNQNDIPDHIL